MAKTTDDDNLDARWEKKRNAVYTLRDNIRRLKIQITSDLGGMTYEKEVLTALVIRIMMLTSERVGNDESAKEGHFGVTVFQPEHVIVGNDNRITLNYVGKSGVEHEKSFVDPQAASILRLLKRRKNKFIFTTKDGVRIRRPRVLSYLKKYGITSKDIRGYNANRYMVQGLKDFGIAVRERDRITIFNELLRKTAAKIGHGANTLRTHYLLPEIEEEYMKKGTVAHIEI